MKYEKSRIVRALQVLFYFLESLLWWGGPPRPPSVWIGSKLQDLLQFDFFLKKCTTFQNFRLPAVPIQQHFLILSPLPFIPVIPFYSSNDFFIQKQIDDEEKYSLFKYSENLNNLLQFNTQERNINVLWGIIFFGAIFQLSIDLIYQWPN